MIKERYVNFEVASLLRDKGFDEPCHATYDTAVTGGKPIFSEYDVLSYFPYGMKNTDDKYNMVISAPTQSMACDWLREKYKIHIVLLFMPRKGYVASICDISDLDNLIYMVDIKYYPDIESAYNEALKYVLTNVNYPT